MNKGFTLRSFLSILAVVFVMVIIAFAVQRREKRESQEITPEIKQEERDDDINNEENNENLSIPENNEEVETIENIETKDDNSDIIEYNVDCGPANNLVNKAKQDLSSRINTNIELIKTKSCEENVFSDYTLGTSNPGEIYNQVPTKGYVLIFTSNNQEYRYHVNENNIIFIN
jgi:hypothetical protein